MPKKRPNSHLPPGIARRILARAARGEKAVVVLMKNGTPISVCGLKEYLQRKDLAKKVKPWEYRQVSGNQPDPLGAVDGKVLLPVTRENMYE